MDEQIELLKRMARSYLMIATAMKKQGNLSSMRSYAAQGMDCCKKALELEIEWSEDKTELIDYKLVA